MIKTTARQREARANEPRRFASRLSAFARAVAVSSLVLLCGFSAWQPADAAGSKRQLSDIERLEMKFFHRTYEKKDMEQRVDRIEKLVYGEAKEGSIASRMAGLVDLVPTDEEEPVAEPPQRTASGSRGGSDDRSRQARKPSRPDADAEYPAVSAIEQKMFGRDFSEDDLNFRLSRLETKAFGKPSRSDDLSERMDKLKAATGIDIARNPPPGTDWAEDDIDIDYPKPSSSNLANSYRGLRSSPGADGMSFSGRNLREDFEKAFGRRGSGGSGSYGMSGTGGSGSIGSSSSGSYGFGGSSGSSMGSGSGISGSQTAYMPPRAPSRYTAPPRTSSYNSTPATAPPRKMGLNQQVEALESEIFGKVYPKDPLPERIARLEKTVFPTGSSGMQNQSLPARVSRLVSVVPISTPSTLSSSSQQIAQQPNSGNNIPGQQRRSGLSKIMGAMGNFISGGMSVGGFPVNGNLYTDPQTGLLVDSITGNLIDPHTGMVVGRRSVAGSYPTIQRNYGWGSFNNGFSSPYYNNPYSRSGIRFGGSGVNFGTGMGSFGGMWP